MSPPRAPSPVPCKSKRCNHLVVFDVHYNKVLWDDYVEQSNLYREQQKHSENDV